VHDGAGGGGGAGAAAWTTEARRPAITTSPVRAFAVFAAAVNATLPLPVPDPPDVMVNHDASLDAVHVQSARVVTVMAVPAPPLAPMSWVAGATA